MREERLILLDAGGVVLDGLATERVIDEIARVSGAAHGEVGDFYQEQIKIPANTGQMEEAEVYQLFREQFGPLDGIRLAWLARSATLPLPGVREALEQLSQHAPVWMLSNYIGPWLRDSLFYWELLPYFQRLFISSETGVRKPEPRAFTPVLSEWEGAPAQICFVDNQQPNLDSATGLGLSTVLADSTGCGWLEGVQAWLERS